MNSKAFTLIELLIVIGILILLAGISIPALYSFQKNSAINNVTGEIINNLKLVRSNTLASQNLSEWGIYFTNSTIPHQYTLFKGQTYELRDVSFDKTYQLSKDVEFSEINLNGTTEIVFERLTGITNSFGMVSISLKDNPQKSKTIYVEGSGQVGLEPFSSVSDENRLKDSRHVHFDYAREISTSTEKLILTFDEGFVQEIVISENMKNEQIYWEREIEVGEEKQMLKILTHRLNNPDTEFSITRDKRYNNKAFNIDIDGDPDYPTLSPILIRYASDGSTIKGDSFYVSSPIWQ